jgi:hypothetical protein
LKNQERLGFEFIGVLYKMPTDAEDAPSVFISRDLV